MKTIKFENLIDTNTGKTVEIEVPDDFDENNPSFAAAGERGRAFGARVKKVNDHLREVQSLNEVAELGREAGEKIAKAMGIKNLK